MHRSLWKKTYIPRFVDCRFESKRLSKVWFGQTLQISPALPQHPRGLTTDALETIQEIPADNTKLPKKIAAGVINLTIKCNKGRSYELVPSTLTARDVLLDLVNLKEVIKNVRPDAVVSFITILPITFFQQLKYWVDKKRLPNLWGPKNISTITWNNHGKHQQKHKPVKSLSPSRCHMPNRMLAHRGIRNAERGS